jgi:uncharacterized integral membrane protein
MSFKAVLLVTVLVASSAPQFVQGFLAAPKLVRGTTAHHSGSNAAFQPEVGAFRAKRSSPKAVCALRMVMGRQGSEKRVVEGPFEGQFGTWVVDEDDAAEVLVYRGSLVVAAFAVATGCGMALLPVLTGGAAPAAWSLDLAAAVFLGAFGVSLKTIHIYMKPMHDMLKALWLGGVVGSIAVLAASETHSLVLASYLDPINLLGPGWAFVALTGLFFKEFACFQRLEASVLFGLVPLLTGGHFLHFLPLGVEQGFAAALAGSFVFFAIRKFDLPLKADIGDKTVFAYITEQEAAAQRGESQP